MPRLFPISSHLLPFALILQFLLQNDIFSLENDALDTIEYLTTVHTTYICTFAKKDKLNAQLKDFSNNVNVQEENGMTPLVENCMYGY